ncbi:MAG TPA: ATP-binding protein [Candidatus Limnocylindria bacterium]|nr:ATP-binding protein [Candidatus Limnocylindria bacterium]
MTIVDPAIIPSDDVERLAAINRYAILDTPPDGAFDRITSLAARVFGVPIAIVSVVDHDRIWFKSHYGLDVEEIDRAPGLCASAILQDGPWIVNDAPSDPRALANPLVAGEFGLKFYAGVPLRIAGGYNLGTLCILGFEPREMTADETAILQDLAQMVVGELELRLSSRQAFDAASERERVKDAFVGMLSHELRTPLTTIYAAARILVGTEAIQGDARASDLLPDIISESERLLHLIEDLLVLSKIEQGSLESGAEPVLLQRVIERTVARILRHEPDRTINIEIPTSLPPVAGEEVFAEQVVGNLLSNALKYSPADAPVEVSGVVVGNSVELRVRDRGIGVKPDQREEIFDLLVRTAAAADYAPGAGIGLYVCRRLMHAMGGEIWAELPIDGPGTVFALRLQLTNDSE